MKKFGKLKLLGLVAILTGALIFMGINYLEAKKPSSRVEKWMAEVSILDGQYSNLFGDGTFYENNEFVQVTISKNVHRKRGLYYSFWLAIKNDKIESDDPGSRWIGFQDVSFDNDYSSYPEENPGTSCILPGDECVLSGAPYCMECFLNNNCHPSWGYWRVFIHFTIFYDIESLSWPGGSEVLTGSPSSVHISICNDYPIIPIGSEDIYHEVFCFDGIENLTITRTGENAWTLELDQPLTFREEYFEECTMGKGKGRKPGRAFRTPIIATTLNYFKFQATWTRLVEN